MDYKIAIVGPEEEVAGFAGLGIVVHDADSQDSAEEQLFDLKKTGEYAIIFVIESFIEAMDKEKYAKLSAGALPAVIPVPGHNGASGFGETKIKRIVEKAVGSDIF